MNDTEYTLTQKNIFFTLMNRLFNLANGYADSRPKHSTIARMNDLVWLRSILAPETRQAEELIEEWILNNGNLTKQ